MNAPVPIRKSRRTPVIRRNDRSRRMSRSHAPRAIVAHDRPSRGSPGGPSGTQWNVASASTSWRSPTARKAAPQRPVAAPSAMTPNPRMTPVVRMTPMSPLATPTWGSATRSGTKPW